MPRRANSHAIATGQRMRQIMSSNPGIKPQQALAMASKQTSMTKGKGLYIAPPMGSGLYINPFIGRSIRRRS